MTPFLAFIRSFSSHHDNLLVTISNKINQQSFLHGNNRRLYQLTNADVFDKFADQSNYYNYNPSLTNEEKLQIATDFLDSVIVKPFINILKEIIAQGGDVHAQVQKLKRYRDIEEKKRLELLQLAEGENAVMADVKPKEKEEKVSRREEKLAEIRNRRMAMGRGKFAKKIGRHAMQMGYQQPAPQVNDDDGKENYDKINGDKVLREFGHNGGNRQNTKK